MVSNPSPELLELRTISGTGSLRIPSDKKELRKYWLVADLLREPNPDYRNKKFPLDKGNYANILWLDDKKNVCNETVMEYQHQVWVFYADLLGQILYSVECGFQVTQINIATAISALGGIATLSPFDPVTKLETDYAMFAVKCRDGAAIYLRLFGQDYSLCPDQEKEPQPPPDKNPPPGTFPSDVPFDGEDGNPLLSPPYDVEGGDPFFNPFPGDVGEEPDPEPTGTAVTLRFTYRITGSSADDVETAAFWEPVLDVFLESGKIKVTSFGYTSLYPAPLSSPVTYTVAPPDPFVTASWSYEVLP